MIKVFKRAKRSLLLVRIFKKIYRKKHAVYQTSAFIFKENYLARKNFWKILCLHYAICYDRLIKKGASALEHIIHIVYKIPNWLRKNKHYNYQPSNKLYDRKLKGAFFLIAAWAALQWFLNFLSTQICFMQKIGSFMKLIVIFAPMTGYLLISFLYFITYLFKKEFRKHDLGFKPLYYKILFYILFSGVFLFSFLVSIFSLILHDYSKYIIISLSSCVYSALVNLFTVSSLLELIKISFNLNLSSLVEMPKTGVYLILVTLFLINIPLIISFQSILEHLDSRWKKINLIQSPIIICSLFVISFIYSPLLLGYDEIDGKLEHFKMIIAIGYLIFYVIILLSFSYKIVKQKPLITKI